jgi:predicted DNA-binding transcriptional regulator YafY
MKIHRQIQRLNIIHKLIEREETGTPDEFARRVHISKRQLYNILDEFKLLGAPIKYDMRLKTYVYTKKCKAEFSFEIKVLSKDELDFISGGCIIGMHNQYIIGNIYL